MVISHPRPTPRPIALRDVLTAARLLPVAGHDDFDAVAGDLVVTGIAMDSRKVQPGDVYLAVGGAAAHGAQFAAQAAASGAAAVVTDAAGAALMSADQDLPIVVVEDPRPAAGRLAAAVYGHPSAGLTVVGITGTNGKTTMSFMIASALRAAGAKVGVIGTTGIYLDDERLPAERTTPEAVELHAILAHLRERGITAVVMEVSSHAIVFGRVGGVEFDVAVFTNLTQDHLDFHGSMDSYFEAKASFIAAVPRAVVCADDQWGAALADRLPEAKTYAIGPGISATWTADGLEVVGGGMDFTLHGPAVADPSGVRAHVGLIGAFNVANATGTAAAVCGLGVDISAALAGIRDCPGVPGRMQPVPNDLGLSAYVDYAHTPDAVTRAIEAAPGRVVAVVGCGGDRDKDKRPLMGEAAARLADFVVITDDNPRSEDPAAIRAAIWEGVRRVSAAQRAEVLEVADRRAAIRVAIAAAKPGDSVLLLGKGHEQGQTVGTTVHPFDDVTELAAAMAEAAGR
ncbi:MAG: UDP-N-acetylmuramoyl-L-alanyl-D-glutamate--2,6-diaminopimelate ligase [Candidatus Nanopelagicales bacterium]